MIEITNVNFRYAGPEPAGVKDINLCICVRLRKNHDHKTYKRVDTAFL